MRATINIRFERPCDMLQVLRFGSCYVYSPTGLNSESRRSRVLCARVKSGDPESLMQCALGVRRQIDDNAELAGFFGGGALLVPIPGSRQTARNGCSISDRIVSALLGQNVSGSVWPAFRRVCSVARASLAAPGKRPSVACLYRSLELVESNGQPTRVVLIDDVVTKGRTLMAAALRLHDAYPSVEIKAFALVRTMGFVGDVDRWLMPCVGEIRLRKGDVRRDP